MRIKVLIVLAVLVSTIGFSQNETLEDSCSGNLKYYAISKTFAYESMNTNSTIVAEVPTGEQVVVVSTFFGDHGWWKICYKGTIGHAEKAHLSDILKSPEDSGDTELVVDNRDVGFSPFLARATTTLNFRSGPATSNTKIKPVYVGSTIFIYSDVTVNDYYKSIDISTGQIGWVHRNYAKNYQDVIIKEDGIFESTGYTGSQNPEILVTNNSTQEKKLILGEEIIFCSPNTTKSVKVEMGRRHYIIITPGIIPVAGYQTFESNTKYKLEF